jgi:hypothetical protein
MRVVIKNPGNSKWKDLRPPFHIEPAYFNMPANQVLNCPEVHDPYTSPYRARKAVIVNTEMEIPEATYDESMKLADLVKPIVDQTTKRMSGAQRHQVVFHAFDVYEIEPTILDARYGRTLACSMKDSSKFGAGIIETYMKILAGHAKLWRLYLNAGYDEDLQLTIFHDALLIGKKIVSADDFHQAVADWQLAAKDCWKS